MTWLSSDQFMLFTSSAILIKVRSTDSIFLSSLWSSRFSWVSTATKFLASSSSFLDLSNDNLARSTGLWPEIGENTCTGGRVVSVNR